jgi:hypothetical protein
MGLVVEDEDENEDEDDSIGATPLHISRITYHDRILVQKDVATQTGSDTFCIPFLQNRGRNNYRDFYRKNADNQPTGPQGP